MEKKEIKGNDWGVRRKGKDRKETVGKGEGERKGEDMKKKGEEKM